MVPLRLAVKVTGVLCARKGELQPIRSASARMQGSARDERRWCKLAVVMSMSAVSSSSRPLVPSYWMPAVPDDVDEVAMVRKPICSMKA